MLGVSKGSISLWVRGVKLSEKARLRLQNNYTKGQLASQKSIQEKTLQKILEAEKFAAGHLDKFDLSLEIALLLCSIIYECEGSKRDLITFTNSDPNLIKTFLFLFRSSFSLDERKFRIVMHLHNYHNENTQKKFWSRVSKVSPQQFSKTFIKNNTGMYKKLNYQGCIQVRYRDVVVGRKLQAVAKMFLRMYK